MENIEIKIEDKEYNTEKEINPVHITDFVGSAMIMPNWTRNHGISIDLPKNQYGKPLIWKPNYTFYIIGNSVFNKDFFEKVIKKELVLHEILRISNIEQRMQVLAYYGIEWLLKETNATLIDKSDRGNELYQIIGVFRNPAYFLKYKDISTDRVYFSGIDPQCLEGVKKNEMADTAMAWKLQWELKEYNQLKIES